MLMSDHGLGDLAADVEHRVERRHRVLEDHPDAATADAAQHRRRRAEQLRPSKRTEPAATALTSSKPRRRQHRCALARARLADDGSDLATVHGEVEPAHGMDLAATHREADVEAADVEQRGGGRLAQRLALTSSASRRPSPRKLKAMPTVRMAMPGATAIHHW